MLRGNCFKFIDNFAAVALIRLWSRNTFKWVIVLVFLLTDRDREGSWLMQP